MNYKELESFKKEALRIRYLSWISHLNIKFIEVNYPDGDYKFFLPEEWFLFREGILKLPNIKIKTHDKWTIDDSELLDDKSI